MTPPGDRQQGQAAQAMQRAEAVLVQQLSTAAEFDRQIMAALRQAHKTTVEGRRRLDGLEGAIADAARAWDLSTAAGAREFQRFLIAKLAEITAVVQEANDDDSSKRALAAALTSLYTAESGRGESPPEMGSTGSATDSAPATHAPADELEAYPDDDPYLDWPVEDESEPVQQGIPGRQSDAPGIPMVPGLGGDGPGFGAMPAAMPAGIPSAGWMPGPDRDDLPGMDAYPPEDPDAAGDAISDGDGEADGGGPYADAAQEDSREEGPVTVRLPDGATTTVANPQLAAAMQAAADGQPVADAFRRQGIDVPPPGTPVTAPVDANRLRPGDLGVFTDRHALAVGDGKALLDGQIHLVDNLRGPGFLGWQHPPAGVQEPAPASEPAPTRPAMTQVVAPSA